MDRILFFALYIFFVFTTVKAKQTRFARFLLLEGKNITDFETVASKSKKNAAADCARSCVKSGTCQSFFFSSITGECQFHDALFLSTAGATDQEGIQYYYLVNVSGRDDWCPVEKGFELLTEIGPCVKFHTDIKTWYEANQTCVSYSPYSRLAILDNKEKNDLVKAAGMAINNQLETGSWIGLLKDTDDVYKWIDGRDVDFTDWGHSGDSGYSMDCVWLQRKDAWRWHKNACTVNLHYVCEIALDPKQYHQMMDL